MMHSKPRIHTQSYVIAVNNAALTDGILCNQLELCVCVTLYLWLPSSSHMCVCVLVCQTL